MPKIITDKNLIEKFLTRGVEKIYPNIEALRKKLMSGERLKVYQGFDPTGPYLHVGHAIGIRALSILQQLGHEVNFLIGDFTAKIGDPDKDTTREVLTDEQIEKNMAGWKKQAEQLIDFEGTNPVQFRKNSEWLAKLTPAEILKLMSKITIQQMSARDLFQRRLKIDDPIRLHEFVYPLLQGYDGVAMKVDIEIGGADQIFNMLVGRDLSKAYLNKEKFVRANKMMDAPDQKTMSKTKGNGINLGDEAKEMYGKAMSYPDNLILSGLELLTDISMSEIENITEQIHQGVNPMQFKKLMAFEIVKIIKGEQAAKQAEIDFANQFQKGEMPEDIIEHELQEGNHNIIDVLVQTKLVASKGEARRQITQNAIKLDSKTITDINHNIAITKSGPNGILQKGKRNFVKIIGNC